MPRRRYMVERAGTRWKIRVEDHDHGAYDSQLEAITAAIEAAHRAGSEDAESSQVLVQRLDPTYRIVWTFGEDPFPPTDRDIAFRMAPALRGGAVGSHDARHYPSPTRSAAG